MPMFYIRCTKTKSKATAVQIVKYIKRQTVIVKHIGSTHSSQEIDILKKIAKKWIQKHNPQLSLFPQKFWQFQDDKVKTIKSKVLSLQYAELISTHSIFVYEVLFEIMKKIGFTKLLTKHPKKQLLLDLVISRLIYPASKLESLQFLENEFGIIYKKTSVYREMASWFMKPKEIQSGDIEDIKNANENNNSKNMDDNNNMNGNNNMNINGKNNDKENYSSNYGINNNFNLKDEVEHIVVNFAKHQLNFDFNIVFYDVTTLYFESFKSDEELKQCGFSKDNKFNQPQLVIGLIVNNQGFPISYEIFSGNKFEGHTFIPILEEFQKKHKIKTFTVVADAAMISQANVDQLVDKKLSYIVGARLGNLGQTDIDHISNNLNKQDQATIRIDTPRGDLICSFSKKRYQKDKYETEKQISRAENAVRNPQKSIKRLKFITNIKTNPQLNDKLINKTKKLWGIKGYYTNVKTMTNEEIIYQYRQLWRVEKSFRITKSDLQARPIYHRNTDTIKAHILICFMALSVAKYLEIRSNFSLQKNLKLLKTVKDAKIHSHLTDETITMRSTPSTDVENLLKKLDIHLSY